MSEIEKAYEQLGRWVAETVCDGDNWMCDFDGYEAGQKMLEFGILAEVRYDPDEHGEIYFACDPEPGDKVQIFADGYWPPVNPPQEPPCAPSPR